MRTDDSNTLRHPAITLLCDLIQRPSVTPDDAGCQEILIERLTAIGFKCETMQFGDVTNFWARRGSDGPLLCFAGHTDVVPPGELDNWSSDPFDPVVREDAIYGRGSADMKSGLAAMIVALESFVAANPNHDGSLAMLITSDEEGRALSDQSAHPISEHLPRGLRIELVVGTAHAVALESDERLAVIDPASRSFDAGEID